MEDSIEVYTKIRLDESLRILLCKLNMEYPGKPVYDIQNSKMVNWDKLQGSWTVILTAHFYTELYKYFPSVLAFFRDTWATLGT